MTIWELIRVLLRYWPVVIVGALCTSGAGLAVTSVSGVYFTRATIVFLAPASTPDPNPLRTQLDDVITTAGVVGKRVSGAGPVPKFAEPSVTPIGLGMSEGWTLTLPDTGGQWASNFVSQTLVLDVVGPSRESVRTQQKDVIRHVQAELFQLQRDAGVHAENQIVAEHVPDSPLIFYVGGNMPRALGMTAALGIGLTIAACVAFDRHRRRKVTSRDVETHS